MWNTQLKKKNQKNKKETKDLREMRYSNVIRSFLRNSTVPSHAMAWPSMAKITSPFSKCVVEEENGYTLDT